MILKAHDAYNILALSKPDLKPFLKIEHFLLGFAGCCFFQKLPPEGRLNHETYVSKLFKNQNVKIEIVYTSDPKNIEIENVYISDPQNVKIENIYTSDSKKIETENDYTSDSKNVEI